MLCFHFVDKNLQIVVSQQKSKCSSQCKAIQAMAVVVEEQAVSPQEYVPQPGCGASMPYGGSAAPQPLDWVKQHIAQSHPTNG